MAIYEHIHTNIYTFDDRFETQISKQKGHHVKRLQATNGGGGNEWLKWGVCV